MLRCIWVQGRDDMRVRGNPLQLDIVVRTLINVLSGEMDLENQYPRGLLGH